jgi:hypothetical protein
MITPISEKIIATIEAKHTAMPLVVAQYDMEDKRGKYYLLHCTDTDISTRTFSMPIHISVLGELAELLLKLKAENEA